MQASLRHESFSGKIFPWDRLSTCHCRASTFHRNSPSLGIGRQIWTQSTETMKLRGMGLGGYHRRRLEDFPVPEHRPLKLFLQIIDVLTIRRLEVVSDTKSLETNYRCYCNKPMNHRLWHRHGLLDTSSGPWSGSMFLVKSHFLYPHKWTKFHRYSGKNSTPPKNHKARNWQRKSS